MGIDIHNLGLLAHGRDLGVDFSRAIGIGRQALFVDPPELDAHRALRGLTPLVDVAQPGQPRYFEPLMQQWLGATTVDSIDASPYEKATFMHDMNLPLAEAFPGRGSYDAVLDFGCLEHVFDFAVAWRNCVALCRVGGHLIHALPANNLCGHGFYQFSPELFFNLYQRKNGFRLRGVWFASKAEPRYWWTVADPSVVRRRVTLRNAHEVYMMVIAQKLDDSSRAMAPPQQSDYAESAWLQPASSGESTPTIDAAPRRSAVASALASMGWLGPARRFRERLCGLGASGLGLPPPDYCRIDVANLLRRSGQRR
jgi:SAM-dependent methyltransferase